MSAETKFNEIVEEAKSDPNIVGFWVGGSRGKGIETKYSDYDCVVVVKDGVLDEYKKKFAALESSDFEFWVKTLQIFREYAEWGTENAWDRYNYTHVKPIVDKTGGEIEKLFEEKGMIPKDKVKDFVSGNLDAYLNQVYRSFKCLRDGNPLASQLEAADSISCLFNAIFGLEGRLRPYYKYIQWELIKHPLQKIPWLPDEFLQKVLSIVQTADMSVQRDVLTTIEPIFRAEGYGATFDGWGNKLDGVKNFATMNS